MPFGNTIEKLQDRDNKLTGLMINYIHEAIASGTVFVDPADPLAKGNRLFKWATDSVEAISKTRANANHTTAAAWSVWPAIRDQMIILDEVIVDEHPQLLGALFSVLKATHRIDDGGQTSRAFITNVRDQCRKRLGGQHIISSIFACLCEGEFDLDLCLERLEVLPSELFAKGFRVSEPTFERDVTSDYETVASLSSERFKSNPSTREPLSPETGSSYHRQDGPFFGSGGFDNSNFHQISTFALPLRTRRDMYPQLQEPQQLFFGPQPILYGDLPALDSVDPETEPQKREATPSVDDESLTESDFTASESSRDITMEDERMRIVDTVMDIFLQRLDYYLEELGCCDEEAMNIDSEMPEEVHTHQRGSGTGASSSALNGHKRVKRADGKSAVDHEDTTTHKDEINRENESEDEGKDDQRRRKKPQQAEKTNRDLLACPYFKWKPRRYYQEKPCCGPGTPCDKFGLEVERRLRLRSKGKKSEVENWAEMYKTLFDARDEDIPTPYYDLESAILAREETMREYATREIGRLMREQVEIAVAREFTDIPQNLVGRILEMLRNVELSLRHGFQMSRGRAHDACEEDAPDEDASEDEVRMDPPNAVQHDREEEAEDIKSSEAGPCNQPRDPGSEVPGPVGHYPIGDQQQDMDALYQEYGVAELDQSWIFNMGGYQGDVGWNEILFQLLGNNGVDAEKQQGRTIGADNWDGQQGWTIGRLGTDNENDEDR
ncbi:hypothetical protein CSOJ01_05864 [Colletotrichum sojae]|uniref:Uncharacterized protein n=1 Tax=Colletotrichum sojae TaxID=2175907 RepID=A0A8H6JER2_9PEZI|nr:hypothetical protein CSOJ01_05864 [Colletotrichum sojae]